MILLLDNYDSFVYNLARYLREVGEEVRVVRNDALEVEEAVATEPSHLVVSPGPCTPAEAGIATPLLRKVAGRVPVLGVCLGHQCIGTAFGGRVVRARAPMHGKSSRVRHRGEGLFAGLPNPLRGIRYHSLVVDRDSLPEELEVTAWSEGEPGDGEIMALRHRSLPVWGVQFHPEAILTQHGHALLRNFLALGRGEPPPGPGEEREARELAGAGPGSGAGEDAHGAPTRGRIGGP